MNAVKRFSTLAERDPEIASQWVQELNGERFPFEVAPHSNEKFWWQCPVSVEHLFLASVHSRVKSTAPGKGCPHCAGKIAKLDEVVNPRRTNQGLTETHPDLAKQWDFELNEISPDQVSYGSSYEAYWICPLGKEHKFKKAVYKRVRSLAIHKGCPICDLSSRRWQPQGKNFHKPLPKWLAEQWDYEVNDSRPEDYHQGSRDRVGWRCSEGPDHQWMAYVYARARGTKCPCCAGQQVSVTNSLAALFPEIAREWSVKNELTAEEVSARSNKYGLWQCSKNSRHKWSAKVLNRTLNGSRCPHCPKLILLNSNIDFKALASELAPTANRIVKKKPLSQLDKSETKLHWICKQGHTKKQSISRRVLVGCSDCR